MADDEQTCPSCGARVPAGADQCDLCGTPVQTGDDAPTPADDVPTSDAASPDASAPDSSGDDAAPESPGAEDAPATVYCNQCGHENPSSANFCSRCGTELQDLSTGGESEGTRAVTADLPEGQVPDYPSAAATEPEDAAEVDATGTQLLWMVGLGVAVVLVFFGLTQWSQQYEWGGGEEGASPPAEATTQAQGGGAASGPAGPAGAAQGGGQSGRLGGEAKDLQGLVTELSDSVSGAVSGRIDSLRALEDGATGSERQDLRRQLVRLYIGAGTPGRAALLQRTLADETGAVEDRRRGADLLYRWMRKVEQKAGRARVSDVARHVAAAYSDVVEQRPEDLDARTRMGEAYMLTNNPMKGIQAINGVLKDDSTFVPARFQKGLALLQINRLDQAVEQFERVKAHAEPTDPFHKQATRAIEVIREQASKQEGESNGAGS